PAPTPEGNPKSDQPEVQGKSASLKKRRRVAGWMHRHRRTLPAIGAFIVFATFVSKEGLREKFRDLADSVDRAESLYLLRSDIKTASYEVHADTDPLRTQTDVRTWQGEYITYIRPIVDREMFEIVDTKITKNLVFETGLLHNKEKQLFIMATELATHL